MPRKFLRRWLPAPQTVSGHKWLRWLGPIVDETHLFHLNRYSVSTAFFIGLFVAFLPMPGHILAVSLLAVLLRCNLPISFVLVWLSNPVTMVPMLAMSYQIGLQILNRPSALVEWQFTWNWLQEQGSNLIVPLVLGSVVSGLAFGLIGFIGIRILWRWRVIRRWEARKRMRHARAKQTLGNE